MNKNILRKEKAKTMASVNVKGAQAKIKSKIGTASGEQWSDLAGSILTAVIKTNLEHSGYFVENTVNAINQWSLDIDSSLSQNKGDTVLYILPYEKINTIKQYYELINIEQIINFINKYRFSIDFLIDAAEQFRNEFGNETKITLRYLSDPSLFNDEGLVACIYTSLSVKQALDKVDKLDEIWFLQNRHISQGRFIFDVEWA